MPLSLSKGEPSIGYDIGYTIDFSTLLSWFQHLFVLVVLYSSRQLPTQLYKLAMHFQIIVSSCWGFPRCNAIQ